MEWIVMGVVGVLAVGWWLGRSPTTATPPARAAAGMAPLAAEVARRAADPNDPDGAFMDGYVSGRYTEQYLDRSDPVDRTSSTNVADAGRNPGDDDPDDNIWADPQDSFDDDSSDDW